MDDSQALSLKLFVVASRMMKTVVKKIEADIKNQGLNPTDFAVLELLYSKGPQPIQKIAEAVLLSSGSMTYVIDKLEKKGLLKRTICVKDSRVKYGKLTTSGKILMDEITPQHYGFIDNMFSVVSDDEKISLIALLKRIGYENTDP